MNLAIILLQKLLQLDGGGPPQDRPNHSTYTTTVESVPDPTATDLTLLRMKSHLLPLILKQEILDLDSFWQPAGHCKRSPTAERRQAVRDTV
jgi:hypothetical protein